MTESEWLQGDTPANFLAMLRCVTRSGNSPTSRDRDACWRKLRLLLCGYWRQQVARETQRDDAQVYQEAIEVAERYADGQAGSEELQSAREVFERHPDTLGSAMYFLEFGLSACHTALEALRPSFDDLGKIVDPVYGGWYVVSNYGNNNIDQRPLLFLKEFFGNQFRPCLLDPECLTQTVVSVARAVYENRNSSSGRLDEFQLCVLADALEEGVCLNLDLLSHLRRPGPHFRGCWAVDCVLGR